MFSFLKNVFVFYLILVTHFFKKREREGSAVFNNVKMAELSNYTKCARAQSHTLSVWSGLGHRLRLTVQYRFLFTQRPGAMYIQAGVQRGGSGKGMSLSHSHSLTVPHTNPLTSQD